MAWLPLGVQNGCDGTTSNGSPEIDDPSYLYCSVESRDKAKQA
jgi:hypothetical protein